MLWKDKIKEWKQGIYIKYPTNIKTSFFYETSVCDKNMNNKYEEIFIENNSLQSGSEKGQDYSAFIQYINMSQVSKKNKYVVAFPNLSGDSIMIIPIPKKNKNFSTIKDFIDNASVSQQTNFWKEVAKQIEIILKTNNKIYISTHGLGQNYFHLRLDKTPKYYQTKSFI